MPNNIERTKYHNFPALVTDADHALYAVAKKYEGKEAQLRYNIGIETRKLIKETIMWYRDKKIPLTTVKFK